MFAFKYATLYIRKLLYQKPSSALSDLCLCMADVSVIKTYTIQAI